MRFRKTLTFFILAMALVFALPAMPQQKPFTQEQVVSMVRDGFGDESGAKLIEQRGIDFAPSEDFIRTLKTAGASEAFLKALRAAKPPEPAGAKKPLNQVQVIALLASQVPSHRVTMLVQERGLDFDPTDDYLQEVRLAGGEDELIAALKGAKVTKPATVDPAAETRQAEIRQRLARGQELSRNRQYAEAEREVRAALQLDPQASDLHSVLGVVLGNKGDWDGATAEYREALRLNPKNEDVRINLGATLGATGDRDGEIAEYHEVLRLNPNNDTAHTNLGAALWGKGDHDGAIAEYREALRLNPNNDTAHANLGVALGDKGEFDGEIAEYREALRLNPMNEATHKNLGRALAHKGDVDGETAEYREAVRLNPNDDGAHTDLGAALGSKGDPDGAIAEFREALRLNPKNEKAHNGLGFALAQKGDHLAEAPPTDISGEWQSLYSGLTFRVRLEGGHAYVEQVVSEAQRAIGTFQMCDLKFEDGQYQGVCSIRYPVTYTYVIGQTHKVCTFQVQRVITKYTSTRVEGSIEEIAPIGEWSLRDYKECGKRFKPEWKGFVWIRPN